jgi:ribosomal protein S18 acetylase RimI-like enzyme
LNLNKSPNKNDKKDYAELLSIAVLPSLKGMGYGKLLLEKFEVRARNIGISSCVLTTDFYDNDGVIKFYKSNNYEIYYDFITYPNRRMYKMIKKLL